MSERIEWRRLYVFTALALVILFLLPPNNEADLIIWALVAFGGLAVWLGTNQSKLAKQSYQEYLAAHPPVSEFFDEDRLRLQRDDPSWDDHVEQRSNEGPKWS